MSLLDLKTDLKSLKYGKDRPGGGDSGQPYQKVDINTVDSGFNRFRMTKFDDGLVRGGVVGAANAAVVDTLRIGKFLKDFPKGPLFIVKQVGLQLSNPILEHKTNFPTNRPTREQGLLRNVGNFISNTANKILNAVGPTRIYNLGINTLAQVPVNAFGQHIIRHGFLPKRDDSNLYLSVAQYNNNAANNRLTQLTSKFGLGDFQTNPSQDRKLANTLNIVNSALSAITKIPIPKININPEQLTINKYYGGPGSIYGLIGNTLIQRYTFTEDASKIDPAKNRNYNKQHISEVRIKKVWDYGISSLSGSVLANDDFNLTKGNVNDETPLFNYNVTSYNAFEEAKNNQSSSYIAASRKLRDDRLYYVEASKKSSSTLSNTTFPGLTSIGNERTTLNDNIVSINDTKNTLDKWDGALTASNDLGLSKLDTSIPTSSVGIDNNAIPYTTPTLKKYAELRAKVDAGTSIDKTYITEISRQGGSKTETFKTFNVNISRNDPSLLYNRLTFSAFRRTNDTDVNDDTLALKFMPLDPFTGNVLRTLKFLGYITDYSENYDSSWGDVKYAGRNEKFYIFNDFKRTATVGFNIPCFNPDELEQKHCDMSELASVLAGKYQDNLLLGGIITRLKVGRYINDQPGIITNLNFSPIEGSSWDLDRGLAFYLKVSFGFTLIHNFLPQYGKCGFIDRRPDPIPETVPEEEDTTPDIDPPIVINTISDIAPTRIDNTFNANLFATKQKAEFQKDKYVPPTKAQNDAARKKFNSLKFSN